MWADVDQVLRTAVEQGDVPFAVATAANRSEPIYEGAAGERAPGSGEAITADHPLRIASMTKMITTVAALQLLEQRTLDLDAPVDSYCPSFASVQVLDGFDGEVPRLRAPHTRATVRQLMSHTSGLSSWFFNAELARWEELTGTPNVVAGTNAIFEAPLVADPGTRFEYGINTDWLGRVVEAVSGLGLDKYLDENILSPLGMATTAFLLAEPERGRCVPVQVRGDDGGWMATDLDWSQEPEYFGGGHGLYSTPRDYLRFQRMLLGGGALDGTRLLQEATLAAAFTSQLGVLDFPAAIATCDPSVTCDFNVGPGYKFGLGLLLNSDAVPGRRAAGTGAWAGIFNTHFWVDRATGVTGAIFTQTLPFVEPRALQLYADYEAAVYQAL
jgi:CubicO group peptidase (beta-lactamase class C family)